VTVGFDVVHMRQKTWRRKTKDDEGI
jgi:hypothetical protein